MRSTKRTTELVTEYDEHWLNYYRDRQRRLARRQAWWSFTRWAAKWFLIVAAIWALAVGIITLGVDWVMSSVR